MCCGNPVSKPIQPQPQSTPNITPASPTVNVLNTGNVSTSISNSSDINAQRAAQVLRDNYHKNRFGNGG